MGLRDKYQTPAAAPTPETVSTGATSSIVDPASELAALRAKLAGRGNVNPPEATIPDDAMQRMTWETADGGAELLTSTEPSASVSSTSGESGTSRKPRSKKATSPAAAEVPSAAGVDGKTYITGLVFYAPEGPREPTLEELMREVVRRVGR